MGDSIRERIIAQELKPGEKLFEETISNELGISRTPVRLALNRLAREGFLTMAPRRSAVVKAHTLRDLLEISQIRLMIESLSVRLAAQFATFEQIGSLEKLLKEHESMTRPRLVEERRDGGNVAPYSLFWRKDYAFHLAILEASGNIHLADLEKGGYYILKSFFLVDFPDASDVARSMEEHALIIEPLKVHDEVMAENAMRRHLGRTVERFHALLAEKGNLSLDSPELANLAVPLVGRP